MSCGYGDPEWRAACNEVAELCGEELPWPEPNGSGPQVRAYLAMMAELQLLLVPSSGVPSGTWFGRAVGLGHE